MKKIEKAFTLIEVLGVIFIIGILIAISIPVFRNYQPSMQLSGDVRQLTSDLRHSQQLAISEQIYYGIRFYPDEDKYEIMKYFPVESVISEVEMSNNVEIQEITGLTNNEVKFNAYGAALETGNIVIKNTNNQTKTINIRPSGFVKIIQ